MGEGPYISPYPNCIFSYFSYFSRIKVEKKSAKLSRGKSTKYLHVADGWLSNYRWCSMWQSIALRNTCRKSFFNYRQRFEQKVGE
jgi:hypothetical protein